jgi:uncharacterized hydrophobic protein (TIGR00271 family)
MKPNGLRRLFQNLIVVATSQMVGHVGIRRWIKPLTRARQNEVLKELGQAASPNFDYFFLVILSSSIATLGLISNSAAVVIGAMLVAPLMTPIIGLSLASVMGERRMFQRALIGLFYGAILAVALSTLLSYFAQWLPLNLLTVLPNEVIARMHPSPLDLIIGMAGGAAAAYALAQPQLSAALPGVAIATALMPPLCVIGIGLSLNRSDVVFGAMLLFLTNLAAISFAGILVFAALGFRPWRVGDEEHGRNLRRSLTAALALVLLVTIPLVALSLRFVGEAHLAQNIRSSLSNRLAQFSDAQIVSLGYTTEQSTIHVVATIRSSVEPSYQQIVALQSELATSLGRPVALQVIFIPTIKLDPLIPPTMTPTSTPGPSPTPTSTFTPTLTFTPSPTASPSPTNTPTSTLTPTPIMARVGNTGGLGVYIRSSPNGPIAGSLPEGAPLVVLSERANVNGETWIEARDALGREAWLPARFVILQ